MYLKWFIIIHTTAIDKYNNKKNIENLLKEHMPKPQHYKDYI